MNDLTEQLTKQLASWSLPEYTEFYVRKKDGSTDTQTWINRKHSSPIEWLNIFNITEVLAPVPSYNEWKQLKIENKQLEKFCEEFNALNVSKENQRLKELLKECRQWFYWYHIDTGTGKEYVESWHKKGREIHQKINQALGEDK